MSTTGTRELDLAGHRTAKKISLGWIESSTRIGLHFLQAIEAEDFGKLPGGIYSVSYLRQYARAIGFDEEVLLMRYHQTSHPTPEPPSSQGRFCEWLRQWQPRRAIG